MDKVFYLVLHRDVNTHKDHKTNTLAQKKKNQYGQTILNPCFIQDIPVCTSVVHQVIIQEKNEIKLFKTVIVNRSV